MAEKPAPWHERHPRWAATLGLLSSAVGVALLITAFSIATAGVDSRWATCKVTKGSTTPIEPSAQPSPSTSQTAQPKNAGETTRTEVCSPTGLTGPAALVGGVGLIMCLPLLRFLVRDLKITVGPVSVEGTPRSTGDAAEDARAASQAVWGSAEQTQLQLLLKRIDDLGEAVEGRLNVLSQAVDSVRKRRRRP